MVKNMCFFIVGHRFESKGGQGMYIYIDYAMKSLHGGVPYPTNKGISYANLLSCYNVTLKLCYLLLLLLLN
jgi:hypothetical protein